MERGCEQRRRQAGTMDSSAHAPRRGSLLAEPTIRPKGAGGPSIVARAGACGIRGGGVKAFGQEGQGRRPEVRPAAAGAALPPAMAAVTARVAATTAGRPSRKRPRPGAAAAAGEAVGAAAAGTESSASARRSRSWQRRSSPWGEAAASLPSSPTAIVKRLLKLGLRLLPLLLGTSDLLLVGATATPTGPPKSPQGANAAGLPPAAGNAKIVLNAATRTLASASSPKGAGRAPGGPKVIPPKAPASMHHHPHHGQRLLDDHSLVKLLFLIIGLFWVLVVVALLYWAPVVSFLNLLVLSVIVLFIKSEGSSWLHHAQEHENRFWTVVAGVGAAVLLFSPDSPLAIGRWSRLLGILLTAAVAFAVHSYDRHLHRVNISRKPQFVSRTTRRTTSSAATPSSSSSLGAASSGPSRGQHGRRGLSTNSLPLCPSQPRSPPGSPPTSQRGPGHGLSTSLPASAAAPSGVPGVGIGGLEAIVEGADVPSGVGRTQRAGPASSSAAAAAVSSPLGGTDAVAVKATPAAETRSLPLSPSLSAARSSPLPRPVPSAVSSPVVGQHKVEAVAALGAAATTAPFGDGGSASLATSATGSSSASGSGGLGDGSIGASEGDGAGVSAGSLPTSPMGAIMTEAQPTSIGASAAPASSAAAASGADSGVTETGTAAPLVPSSSLSSSSLAAAAAAGEEPKPQRLLGLLLESANTVDGEKTVLDAVARAAAEEKLEVVEHALKEVDQYLIASTITNYFNVQRVLRLERTIINIFNVARTEELNFLVSHVPLGLLFYKVKDHTLTAYAGGSGGARCLNRTDLIEVLAVTRISELGIPERAMVLDALQQMKLTAHRQAEKWVRNILLSTLGDSLSELKTLMDAKGDFQSLHKLIFDDIRSERVRHEILVHIRKQAQVQAAHMKLGTRLARQRRERQPWRKILSDVDDTLVSSGGRFPAGMDRRLPRHAVYPGVLAFYRELDLGVTEGADEWGPDRDQGNLVFLSARPHLYKDVSEKHSYAKFRRLQAERGMHTTPTLLAGSLDSGYSYVMERNIEGLAVKKMENFEQFVSLYPEYSFVFIGDNGQGDLRAAELMVKRARETPRHPRIDAVYIHRVQPLSRSYGYDEQAFCRWRDMGICFFENYIEAAVDAAVRRRPPLIRLTGLRRVVEAAVHDFAAIEAWPADRDRELRRVELNRSVLRANDVLARHGLPPVPCLPASTKARFEPGARVMTLYGAGLVRRYRPEDGVYEVVLDWAATAAATAAVSSSSTKVKRLSLNGPSAAGAGGSAAATPLAVTPLSITPPRLEHRARSASIGADPPSPLTLPPPKLRGISEGHQQQPSETSAAAALDWAEAGVSFPPGPHRSSLAPAPPPPTPSSVASLAGTPLPPMTPSMGSVGGVGGAGGPRSSLGGGPYAFPRVTVVAYLQEAAILQAIVPATKQQAAATAAATAASASNATAGLSSYISFFPGASYLTRLRSDRSAHRFAPGTAVRTPYGLGVVIQHRPAKPKPAAAATGAGASGTGEGSAAAAGAAPSAGAVGVTAGAQAVGGAGGAEPVPATVPGAAAGAAAATTTTTAVSSGASVSGGSVVVPAAAAAVAQPPQPQQEAGETCVVQLKWGAKAYLPTSQLALASASSLGAAGAAGLTSPRGGVSKGSSGGSTAGGVAGAASGAESAGLLAGMMSLLSLGSNRGKPTGGASAAKPLLSSSASAPAGLVAREGQLLLVPGMAVTTKLGPAVVKERREADGVTVLALGAGPVATVYVPAAGLTDFLTPRRNRKSAGSGIAGGPNKEGTATPTSSSKRRSLSPRSGGGGGAAGPSLLGFFKATVKEEPPSEAASQPPPPPPPPAATAVTVKEEPPSSPPLTPLPPQPRSRANSVDSEVSSIASTISTTSTGLRGWFARATATTTTASTSSLHPEQQQRAGGSRWRRLAVGDRVSAGKLGEAVVLRVRDLDGVVEVAFTRWRGRAYLRREEVQPAQR